MTAGLIQSLRRPDPPPAVPHRRLILGAAAAVVLAALLTWLIAFSPVFGVRTVSVRGVHALSSGQVEAAAQIKHGTPLVRLDTAAITRRIEALPDVAAARVSTSFPSTVTITVTERTPVGYVKRGGRFALVDRSGDQYRTVRAVPKHLPRFVVPSGTDARTTGGAVATVAAALPATIRAHVASIQALDPDAITLLLTDRRVVRWGSAERSADKARVLAALLPRTTDQTQLDLTDPDQPFTR